MPRQTSFLTTSRKPKKTMLWFLSPLKSLNLTIAGCRPNILANGHIAPTRWADDIALPRNREAGRRGDGGRLQG